MGLRITTNIPSVNAQKSMGGTSRELQKVFAQLSSGSRITKAADDAAGLSISETLKSTIRGYQQAQRNANDGISLVQIAEGGMAEISNIITRLRELAVQASSDTVGDLERSFINKETRQLVLESERISQVTRFGENRLLNATSPSFDFQVDINNDDFNDRISFQPSEINATTEALGIADFDFSTRDGARSALETLEMSQRSVNGHRATLGAIQNRLVSTTENLGVAIENYSAANSRIRDADMAQSTSELARNNVLLNASIGVLAQANQQPAQALRLLN